jgi:hypothetical protein
MARSGYHHRVHRPALLALALLAACGTRRGVPRAAPVDACDVPAEGAALLPWLRAGRYRAMEREPGLHKSRGPHPVLVRTYVNPALAASLASGGEAEHPRCAAAVKELYEGDAETLRGWAVAVKVRPESADGAGWYWYEATAVDGSRVVADGDGVELCTDCHGGGGHDHVLIAYPFR